MNLNIETENTVRSTKKKKVKGSDFLITINSNKSVNCDDKCTVDRIEQIKETTEELAKNLFSKENIPKLLVVYKNKQRVPLTTFSDIRDIKSKSVVEIGPNRGFIHIHAYIRVIHTTNIQINTPMLKKVANVIFRDVLTINGVYKKPYVSVKGVASSAVNFEAYVS